MTIKRFTRHHYFLAALAAAFFAPLVLDLGTSRTFIVVIPATLMVWFAIESKSFMSISSRSVLPEQVIGLVVLLGNFARNILFPGTFGGFGVFDMLVSFLSLVVVFFGVRAIRFSFLLPSLYLVVIVVGYQYEILTNQLQFLQNSLAILIVGALNLIGIQAIVLPNPGDIIMVYGRPGVPDPNPFLLWIEKSCTGVKGMFAYGSLAILLVIGRAGTRSSKIAIAIVGLAGTFLVNVGRLLAIFIAGYWWGVDAALRFHTYVGYGFFIAWVLVFWRLGLRYVESSAFTSSVRPGVLELVPKK